MGADATPEAASPRAITIRLNRLEHEAKAGGLTAAQIAERLVAVGRECGSDATRLPLAQWIPKVGAAAPAGAWEAEDGVRQREAIRDLCVEVGTAAGRDDVREAVVAALMWAVGAALPATAPVRDVLVAMGRAAENDVVMEAVLAATRAMAERPQGAEVMAVEAVRDLWCAILGAAVFADAGVAALETIRWAAALPDERWVALMAVDALRDCLCAVLRGAGSDAPRLAALEMIRWAAALPDERWQELMTSEATRDALVELGTTAANAQVQRRVADAIAAIAASPLGQEVMATDAVRDVLVRMAPTVPAEVMAAMRAVVQHVQGQQAMATEAVRDICVALAQHASADTINVIAQLTRLNDGRRLFATPQIRSVLDFFRNYGYGEAGAMLARLQ